MFNFNQLASITSQIGSTVWWGFLHGGFVLVVIALVYYLFRLYMTEIQEQFVANQDWVFLNVRVPKVNLLSSLAVEQVFAQMHTLLAYISFPGKYVEGKIQLWYSLEIVSLGGKISFILKVPKKMKDLVESAFYAQYSNAEITEVADYLDQLEYDPKTSELELWGADLVLSETFALPIRTYSEFEHSAAEEGIIDPLKPLFEGLTKLQNHELFAVQILISPQHDDEWKPEGESKLKELVEGKDEEENFNLFAFLFKLFSSSEDEVKEKKDKPTILQKNKIEVDRINAVQKKLTKPGYNTIVRLLYLAPKDSFDTNKIPIILGAFKPLGSQFSNKFKPNSETSTFAGYKLSEALEKPYLDFILNRKKLNIYKNFKARRFGLGIKPYILNVEELATIYHLPLLPEEATRVAVEAVESKKSQPPPDLPIGDF